MNIEHTDTTEYKQEYRHIRGITDFKNNYILNYASFTYDCKVYNKIITNDLICTYSSRNLQCNYTNTDFLKHTQDYDPILSDHLKYKPRISIGCYILGDYPDHTDPQPYDIYQVTDIEYNYKYIQTYMTKDGKIKGRPDIKTIHCRKLKPLLILEYRDEDAKMCSRVYKYTKGLFINSNINIFDRPHDKYVFNTAPYMYFIPNFADYPLANNIFV